MPNECYNNQRGQILTKNYYELIHGKSSVFVIESQPHLYLRIHI